MDLGLFGKTAIVTGSSRVIGKAIAVALACDNIRAFVKNNIAMGRFGRPEEVADVAALLVSERAHWVTRASITVDGGQSPSNI